MHQVSWKGVQDPSVHDAIALIIPADADPRATAPVKHRWATESESHLTNGSGSMRCGSLYLQETAADVVKHHLKSMHQGTYRLCRINRSFGIYCKHRHNFPDWYHAGHW